MTAPERRSFGIELRFDGAEVVLFVQGEVDILTAPTMGAALRALVDQGHQHISLDLSRLAFMDAAGLGVIAEVSALLVSPARGLAVRSAPALTRRIIELTGVIDLVTLDTEPDPPADPPPDVVEHGPPAVHPVPKDLVDDLATTQERRSRQEVLDAALRLVTALTVATVDGADGVSVTLGRNGRMTTVASTNETIRKMDAHQYETGQGPCLAAAAEGHTFLAESLAHEDRWPAFVPRAIEEGIASILSTPLLLAGRPVGALNVYSNAPGPFGAHQQELAGLFADQASGLLAGADTGEELTDEQLAERIRTALTSREVIARAQGVYMTRQRISALQAAAVLHRDARALGLPVLAAARMALSSTDSLVTPPLPVGERG